MHKCEYFNNITSFCDVHTTLVCSQCSKQWWWVFDSPVYEYIVKENQLVRDPKWTNRTGHLEEIKNET